MARYIDADMLINNIANIEDLRTLSTKTIGEAISKTPTADVVEVVRCKDCKHWGGVTFGYICRRFSGSYIRNETRENDFCSYGERKDT